MNKNIWQCFFPTVFFLFLAFFYFVIKKFREKFKKKFFQETEKSSREIWTAEKISRIFFIQKTEKAPVKKVLRVFFKEKIFWRENKNILINKYLEDKVFKTFEKNWGKLLHPKIKNWGSKKQTALPRGYQGARRRRRWRPTPGGRARRRRRELGV